MKTSQYLKFCCLSMMIMVLANVSAQQVQPFEGTWALTLPHNGFNDAGWLEVKQENGYIYASMLWYGGSVTPVSHAFLKGDELVVTSVNNRKIIDDMMVPVTSWAELHLEGERLVGTRFTPKTNGTGTTKETFTGKKLPPDGPAPDLSKTKYGPAITLLDQNSLKGWKLIGNGANGWSVKNGVLTNDPVQKEGQPHLNYGNLRTEQEFEDFNLTLEVNIPKDNNSGVYLRGIYEIQVVDSYGKERDPHFMGALYSRIKPTMSAEKPAGEWQTMDITLVDRHVTVILNGKKIIDNQPVRGCTGGALTANEFKPGPLYLQGDHGKVLYRNIVLKPVIK